MPYNPPFNEVELDAHSEGERIRATLAAHEERINEEWEEIAAELGDTVDARDDLRADLIEAAEVIRALCQMISWSGPPPPDFKAALLERASDALDTAEGSIHLHDPHT